MKDQTSGSARVRRNHDQAFKDELIAQSLIPGASVSAIAMQGGINANLLFKWRRKHVRAIAPAAERAATLLPVCVIPDVEPTRAPHPNPPGGAAVHRGARPCVIEVEVAGAVLRHRGAVDESVLGSVAH